MHINLSARIRKTILGFILGGIILVLSVSGSGSPIVHAQKADLSKQDRYISVNTPLSTPQTGRYYQTRTIAISNGTLLREHTINGPAMAPSGFELERQAATLPESNGITTNALAANGGPVYVLGCSATAGGDIAGIDDRSGKFPNLYTGPANGGEMPLDNNLWPTWTDIKGDTYSNNPVIASHVGVDGRAIPGTIEHVWVSYQSLAPDPIGGWTQPYWDAIGDFMRTSQSVVGNKDGDTKFYTYEASPSPTIHAAASLANSSARPLTCDVMASEQLPDGTLGMKLFYEDKGYSVSDCYNQPTDNVVAGGFSFAQFKAEIDAGRPVMLHLGGQPDVPGHSVVGIGYDVPSNTVYLHDGWDYSTHTMTWGTSYAGMPLLMAGIIHPIPVGPGNVSISGNAGVPNATISYTGGSTKASISGYYSLSVPSGWSGTVTPSKPGYTFSPAFKQYINLSGYQTRQHYTATLIPGSNLIQDPSFESGIPNAYWEESSTNFGTPLCDASCGAGAHTGSVWGWFGGTQQYPNEAASLSQTVMIPSGIASLDFYLWIGEAGASSDTSDVFTVKVDGTTVFSANATQINSYSTYMPSSVNVSTYADDAPHVITFSSITTGQVVAFHLDDVFLASTPVVSPPGTFNKTSPSNGAISQSTSPTLSWGMSTGTASYEYCYDKTNDNTCTGWTSNGSSTSKALSDLLAGTTYYWQVRALNPAGTTYANESPTAFWSFTTLAIIDPKPIKGDFNGDGLDETGIFSAGNGTWFIKGMTPFVYGQSGDIPVPADYNGDGKDDIAVFRPSNSTWYLRGIGPRVYGTVGDIPVVADYNGDGKADIAVFRPSNSTWYLYGIGPRLYGTVGDIPVVADYNGDGKADIAVFRPTNSTWYLYGIGPRVYGTVGDIPVVGDYNADGKADIAVFRPTNSTWYIYGVGPAVYGTVGDIPVIGDYTGDGKADITVFRPANNTFYIRAVGSVPY